MKYLSHSRTEGWWISHRLEKFQLQREREPGQGPVGLARKGRVSLAHAA